MRMPRTSALSSSKPSSNSIEKGRHNEAKRSEKVKAIISRLFSLQSRDNEKTCLYRNRPASWRLVFGTTANCLGPRSICIIPRSHPGIHQKWHHKGKLKSVAALRTSSVYLIILSESEVYRIATNNRSSPRGMADVKFKRLEELIDDRGRHTIALQSKQVDKCQTIILAQAEVNWHARLTLRILREFTADGEVRGRRRKCELVPIIKIPIIRGREE